MPRTGGVYAPPAGTKGTPNTTIQSSKYNALVDDLTLDANAARPVTAGGTGATNATAARTALGLEVGTNVQAYDDLLQAIAALTTSADKLIYTTGVGTVALTSFTAFGRSLVDDADATAARTTLGVAIGTNVQAYDALLQAIAGLTTSANNVIMTTGTDTVALKAIGTSGDALPLLNGANTWSSLQTFSGGINIPGGTGIQLGGDDFIKYYDTQNTYEFTSDGSIPGTILSAGKLRLTDTNDAGLASTAHAIQIGPDSGQNFIIDNNEIQSRNNGAGGDLNINLDGGDVHIGSGSTNLIELRGVITTTGKVTVSGNVDATGGLISRGSGPYLQLIDTTSGELSGRVRVNANNVYFDASSDDVNFSEVFRFELDTKIGYVNNRRIRTEGDGRTISVADGGTGSTSASGARSNLGLGGLATLDLSDLVYSGSSSGVVTYPIGSTLLVRVNSAYVRNDNATIYIWSGVSSSFTTVSGSSGGTIPGTWRARGFISTNDGDSNLFQRVS